MTPRADQSYLRAMADLPDGWQLLEAYVAGIKAERDQAEAIARAVIAKVGPLEQRAADLVAQLNHEVEVRRSQKREMQAEIDAARTEAAQAKAALTDWPDAPLPVETSATEAKPRKTVKLDLRNAPSAAESTPARKSNPPLPPLPFEKRRAELERAKAFLASRGYLVNVIDRDAQIRTYRIAGRREAMLLEQVIEFAVHHGMEASHG